MFFHWYLATDQWITVALRLPQRFPIVAGRTPDLCQALLLDGRYVKMIDDGAKGHRGWVPGFVVA